jgi:acyl-homoserine-lactone acylase
VHVSSNEGLNAYGAVTWGQFFVYQGFNENCGWMHTSCFTDVIDEYAERVVKRDNGYEYLYDGKWKKVKEEKVTIFYRTNEGKISSREFTVYRTHHGPVAGKSGDKWLTIKLMNKPINALMQSFLRTKSDGYDNFKKHMKLKANSSNNTVFADKSGNIAFWQGNFVPRRKEGVNPFGQLDGSTSQTEWQGIHDLDEIIHFKNPESGWIQNCNSSPYWATGNKKDLPIHPEYMGPDKQNYRAVHAISLLKSDTLFTLEKLNRVAYDAHLPAFDILIPSLLTSIKSVATSETSDHLKLKQAYRMLELWDKRSSITSTETTLAVYWAYKLMREAAGKWGSLHLDELGIIDFMVEKTSFETKTDLLLETMNELEKDFGTWKVAWGEVNRFQRLTGNMDEVYDDTKMSFPVPFVTAIWGSIATMDTRKLAGGKRQYGESGNSFVAIVEFGDKIRAKTISSGGHSSNPNSPHFNDQGEMFCRGELKDVVFYPDEVANSTVRAYHPGE